jgi:hypothetical protein
MARLPNENNNPSVMILEKVTNLVIALPVAPQLKTSHCVEILALMAKDLLHDKPELVDVLSMREGDTVFSVPARMVQWFDDEAKRRNIGAMDAETDGEITDMMAEIRAI